MLFKLILISFALMIAYAIAVLCLRRLADISRQVADLQGEMRRNDENLRLQVERAAKISSENNKETPPSG